MTGAGPLLYSQWAPKISRSALDEVGPQLSGLRDRVFLKCFTEIGISGLTLSASGNSFFGFQDVGISLYLNSGPRDFVFLSPRFRDQDPSYPPPLFSVIVEDVCACIIFWGRYFQYIETYVCGTINPLNLKYVYNFLEFLIEIKWSLPQSTMRICVSPLLM